MQYTLVTYVDDSGRDIFQEWFETLRDTTGREAIARTLYRLKDGNFGDHKYLRDGVNELRIHVGAGYRVYYSVVGSTDVVLLCGGSKRTQKKDIDNAVKYLRNFRGKDKS